MSSVRERLAQLQRLASQVLPQPSSGRVVTFCPDISDGRITVRHPADARPVTFLWRFAGALEGR